MNSQQMRAVVNTVYGSPDVLTISQVTIPEPRASEIRVKVHATTVGRTDTCNLRAHPFFMRPASGLIHPKNPILGMDFSGTVDAIGKDVTAFSIGDRVFGLTPSIHGAHAEYVCIPHDCMVANMPPSKSFAQVVVGEGAWYANTYLQQFKPNVGDSILIYGASGAIGVAALQLAKIYGCDVTAVVSTRHLELMRSLGADTIIDYTTQKLSSLNQSFDFILDAVGKFTYAEGKIFLKDNGVFSSTDLGPFYQNLYLPFWTRLTKTKKMVMPMPRQDKHLMPFLSEHLESGDFKAVIDRKYSLPDIADAYRYVETARKQGIVVIEV
ncbi:NAD(P)-dependent alcohol dehydrogenase [Aurantivibrio infirmus]